MRERSKPTGHGALCWELRLRVRGGRVWLYPELCDPSGHVLNWCDVPPVDPCRPRQAVLAARIVSRATRGGIGSSEVIRRVRGVAERG